MKQAIVNGKVLGEYGFVENLVIIVEDGIILAVQNYVPEDVEQIDIGGKYISPGLIDIQTNGGAKFYFTQTPTEETLHDICDTSLVFGTTHTLPCLISSSHENILRAIESVKQFMTAHDKGVVGMHLEGPFINHLKRGAHNQDVIRKPTNHELDEIIRYGKGVIKLMTIAPEQFTDEQIDRLLESDIQLSLGHSGLNYEQAQYYFKKGIQLVTHLYNAMTQMGHREPGIVGAAFDNEQVYAPIILDGAHCSYAAARIAYKIKKEKLLLISDASFLGRTVTDFDFGIINATLVDGFYRNKEGNLAGAAISMAEAVQNAIVHVKVPLEEAIKMATIQVARAIKMDNQLGKVESGYPAKFLVFNSTFSSYDTMVL